MGMKLFYGQNILPLKIIFISSRQRVISYIYLSFSFLVSMNINLCYNINSLANNIDEFKYNINAMSISLIYLFSIFSRNKTS